MSEELKAAQARIACLEGEIAKRDARIVELEHRCGVYGLELHNATERLQQAERQIKAIKAQEPVAWISKDGTYAETSTKSTVYGSHTLPLYAAPVPVENAQVVMPERWNVPRPMWKDARQPFGNPLNHADIEAAEKFNLALDEVARLNAIECAACVSDGLSAGMNQDEAEEFAALLNAASVQQVSVPDVSAMARILADRNADACNVNREDNWMIYGQDYIDDVAAMLAAPAAPAADAWIPVGERLPEPGEPVQVWCEGAEQPGLAWVSRHADWSGEWVIPEPQAIGYESITHWMPLPSGPAANGARGGVMSEKLNPCHCGYQGALAGIDHQAGCYLSLACPECSREVTAFTMAGLVEAWNKPAAPGQTLSPVCAAAPNIATTSEHSGS